MKSILSALIAAFNSLMYPQILMLALWPAVASVVVWVGAAIIFWGRWAAWLNGLLQTGVLQKVIAHGVGSTLAHYVVGLLLTVLLLTAIYLTMLVITAVAVMPALVEHVGDTYYPELEPLGGGNTKDSIMNTVIAVAVYCGAWLVSLPFWLLTPLSIVLPLFLVAYLNQRLFRYDALAEHATPKEYAEVVHRSRNKLYVLGGIAGLLQFVPVLNLFAPLYTGLAFTHLCLGELTRLRGGD